jgi:hypothetical protein
MNLPEHLRQQLHVLTLHHRNGLINQQQFDYQVAVIMQSAQQYQTPYMPYYQPMQVMNHVQPRPVQQNPSIPIYRIPFVSPKPAPVLNPQKVVKTRWNVCFLFIK